MTHSPDNHKLRNLVRDAGRRELLQIAEDLLLEGGKSNVSMHAVARRAQCGVGTLYHYFRNREAMLAALVDARLAVPLLRAGQGRDCTGTPVQQLQDYLEYCATWAHAHAKLLNAFGIGGVPARGRLGWSVEFDRMLCKPGSPLDEIIRRIVAEIAPDQQLDIYYAQAMAAAIVWALIRVCAVQRRESRVDEQVRCARRAVLAVVRQV